MAWGLLLDCWFWDRRWSGVKVWRSTKKGALYLFNYLLSLSPLDDPGSPSMICSWEAEKLQRDQQAKNWLEHPAMSSSSSDPPAEDLDLMSAEDLIVMILFGRSNDLLPNNGADESWLLANLCVSRYQENSGIASSKIILAVILIFFTVRCSAKSKDVWCSRKWCSLLQFLIYAICLRRRLKMYDKIINDIPRFELSSGSLSSIFIIWLPP